MAETKDKSQEAANNANEIRLRIDVPSGATKPDRSEHGVKVAISQPTYLPWLGYFDLIDNVDHFVLLDSVQFEKQSWQQRNRIKGPAGLQWLTVPVMFRGRLGQCIKDVEIRDCEFWRNHVRAVELGYRRSRYFDRYFPEWSAIVREKAVAGSLAELNIALIQWFCIVLGIQTPMARSSSSGAEGARCGLLLNLCRSLGADFYLSPIGSADYLLEDLDLFTSAGIEVGFQHYEHPQYTQLFPPFAPYASVLDLLFNEGGRSLEIVKSGRRPAFCPEQVALASAHKGNAS